MYSPLFMWPRAGVFAISKGGKELILWKSGVMSWAPIRSAFLKRSGRCVAALLTALCSTLVQRLHCGYRLSTLLIPSTSTAEHLSSCCHLLLVPLLAFLLAGQDCLCWPSLSSTEDRGPDRHHRVRNQSRHSSDDGDFVRVRA